MHDDIASEAAFAQTLIQALNGQAEAVLSSQIEVFGGALGASDGDESPPMVALRFRGIQPPDGDKVVTPIVILAVPDVTNLIGQLVAVLDALARQDPADRVQHRWQNPETN